MKKLWLFLFLIISANSFAQEVELYAETTKAIGAIPSGTMLSIVRASHKPSIYSSSDVTWQFTLANGSHISITDDELSALCFKVQNVQNLWDKYIIEEVVPNIFENTANKDDVYQYDLRREMEADALKYISIIQENGLELNDPYLENYLYGIVAKIAPKYLLDGRSSNVNILIEQNPSINAGCYPNGTIVINSGLLASLHSEDELVAILAHEIAHYVLDHSVRNINEAIARQKRTEFWAGVATVATAVAEGVVAANNNYYTPGAATVAVAAMSAMIASDVCKQLGMEYNHKQEKEADVIAQQILKLLGYNPNALATAFTRMQKVYVEERNQAMYFNSYSHPSLVSRIKAAGTPYKSSNIGFEQMMSFAVTNAARMKYQDRRFRQCLPLVSQNIENGVATAEDFILKANCLLALENNAESNDEALKLLLKAKELESDNINIYKAEIIATLRSEQNEEALVLLNDYIERLHTMGVDLATIQSDAMWYGLKQYIANEEIWAKNMLIKVRGMMEHSNHPYIIGELVNGENAVSSNVGEVVIARIPNNVLRYSATQKLIIREKVFDNTIIGHEYNSETMEGVVTFDKELTSIGEQCFYNNKNLISITLPETIAFIGEAAFYRCANLESVYCCAQIPPKASDEMFSVNKTGRKIYVPSESVGTYINAAYWGRYANAIAGYDLE